MSRVFRSSDDEGLPGSEGAPGFVTTPEEALALLRGCDGPVILDLDETLYLRNSTEDFIDTARPRLPAFALLRMIELARPWRWTGGPVTRDSWRICGILLLFPWTRLLWRRRVRALAADHANAALAAAARDRRVTIVTSGFRPAVAPLVAALGMADRELVAVRSFAPRDRRDGKLALALRALGELRVRQSLVITDSADDLELLAKARRGALTVWPGACFRPAFADVYYPGRYLSTVKRPGSGYIRRSILQDDLLIWVLCTVSLAPLPALHLAGIGALLVSFWAVYEQGYVDNDLVGAKHEHDPQLSPAFRTSELARHRAAPWVWAVVTGLAGVGAVTAFGPAFPGAAAIWAAVLAAVYLCFLGFNRLDKTTRVWPFAALQLARGGAFAALLPVAPITAAAVGAYVVEKWVPYFVYRTGLGARRGIGDTEAWALPLNTIRLLFFVLLAVCLGMTTGLRALADWPTAALFGLYAFKARRELKRIVAGAARIDR
ncbi:haloacid dehalogenase-like hydrolase (plasmid) [Salipiger sp. H15]|uniref:Haloacid dehalogenase-like hydrolase n=1 Tax=Alloyangia sp. H15 TaxID=3029062 RepID=A0AAU8AQY5_9RHOB